MRPKLVSQSLERRTWARLAAHCSTVLVVLGCGVAIQVLQAQNFEVPAPQSKGGLQIHSVSAYFDYYSQGLPTTAGFQPGAGNLLPDAGGGGSAQIGWTKYGERSTFSLTYTPSYTGQVRYSSVNALNHAFSLNTSWKLLPRWTFRFSATGDLSSLAQFIFSPTTLSNVASAPVSFDDLAAGMLTAKFTNPQFASILTSAPLAQSPARNLLYGQRLFTTGAQASLSYSYSPRLSFTLSGSGNRSQHVSNDAGAATQNVYLLPDTTSATVSLAVSYSLSPRTQLGGSVTSIRVSSSLQDAYTTTSVATLGRTAGRRWFWQIHGGVGVTNPVAQTAYLFSTQPRPVIGGNLGFKTLSHTLLGSYDRTPADTYGVGAATNSSAGISWRWNRPGRAWWLESGFSWQQLQGSSYLETSGWRTTVGWGRALGANVALLAQYAYLNYSGQPQSLAYSIPSLSTAYSLSQSSVRVSIIWTNPATGIAP